MFISRRFVVCLVAALVLTDIFPALMAYAAEPPLKSVGGDAELTRQIDGLRASVVAVGLFQVEDEAGDHRDLFLDWVEKEAFRANSLLELGSGVVIDANPETRRLRILSHSNIFVRRVTSRSPAKDPGAKPTVVFVKGVAGPGVKADIIGADPVSGLAILETGALEKDLFSGFRAAVIPNGEMSAPTGAATLIFGEPQSLIREGENAVAVSHVRRHGWTEYHHVNDRPGAPSPFTLDRERFWLDRFPEPMIAGSPVFRIDGTLSGIASSGNGRNEADWSLEVIPVSTPNQQRILKELSKGYEVEYGFLGLQLIRPDWNQLTAIPDDAFVDRKRVNGARIVGLPEGASDVLDALAVGDIVIAANDSPVRFPMDLVSLIGATPPGKMIEFTVWRSGVGLRTERVRVRKFPLKKSDDGAEENIVTNWKFATWCGLRVNTTLPEMIDSNGKRICRFRSGVLVTHVTPGCAANVAGIKVNDVIERVGERDVNSPAEFYEAALDWTGEVPLTVSGRATEVRVSEP